MEQSIEAGVSTNNLVLRTLDRASISWFHFKTVLIAGMGFFTDAYDLFCISLVTKTIGRIYFHSMPAANPLWNPLKPRNENICKPTDVNGNPQFINGFPNIAFYQPCGSNCYAFSSALIDTTFNPYFRFCGKYNVNFDTCEPYPSFNYPGSLNATMFGITTASSLVGTAYTLSSGYASYTGKAALASSSTALYATACPKPGALPIAMNAAVSGVALCGTLAGQLFWGWAGDVFGRKGVYGFTATIMIVGAIGQSMSFGFSQKAIIGTLCFWRFILGFGIGGDYPLSAVIMSEYASKKTRGAFVGAVFATQGLGYLSAATFTIIVVGLAQYAFPNYGYGTGPYGNGGQDAPASIPALTDMLWRAVLAAGAIPALLTLWWRTMMPETARFTELCQGNAVDTVENMKKVLVDTHFNLEKEEHKVIEAESAAPFLTYLQEAPRNVTLPTPFKWIKWNNGIMLMGCAMTWFLLDIAFYSQNLFQKDVFTTIGWLPAAGTMSAYEEMFLVARAQALIALGSTIPGYWATVFTVDYIGRWYIQMVGFFFMTLWMAILAGQYNDLVQNNVNGFVVFYALTFFFANFGPNSTTFIIPSELFAARFRASCHGISAASGKAGAIIGAFGFLYAAQPAIGDQNYAGCTTNPCPVKTTDAGGYDGNGNALPAYPNGIGLRGALGLLAAINFLGMCFTFFVPETMGRSLEDLSGELEIEEKHRGNAAVVGGGDEEDKVFKTVQVSPA